VSYIYNSTDNRLDFPNPYRIENFFYFIAAGVLIVGALILLFTARSSLGSGSAMAMAPLVFGVGLLIKGIVFAARAMSRLRFFFGRGQPLSLAKEFKPDETGSTDDANYIKDLLRHSSLSFPEPQGPLNGTLYSLIPNLIYAPQRIQLVAQRQFQNALAIGCFPRHTYPYAGSFSCRGCRRVMKTGWTSFMGMFPQGSALSL
jgi:hypothetical protein